MKSPRFFLSQDQSSHWYVIPAERRTEWETFNGLSEDDEASWGVPIWARAIGGNPGWVEFENWTNRLDGT